MAIRHCVVCGGYHPAAKISRWYRLGRVSEGGTMIRVDLEGREPWAGLRGICDGCHLVITSDKLEGTRDGH
jgi:hypothetical protein